MLTKNEINERIKNGWILSSVWFEVMAVDKKITEKTLKKHLKKLKDMKDTIVVEEKFEKVEKVKSPPKNVEEAFSQIVEVKFLTKDIETLLLIVIAFAPSSVEILKPKELTVGIDTLQVIMNSVAVIMHRFAALGPGGVVISAKA